jgi:3-methyladenine DNA glycosylase AlkC
VEGRLQDPTKVGSNLVVSSTRKLTPWLGDRAIAELTSRLRPHLPAASILLINESAPALAPFGFLERRNYLANLLVDLLPEHFETALTILRKILPAPRTEPGYGDWSNSWILVCAKYISICGLDSPRVALQGLVDVTRTFSSEFDVRPFLLAHRSLTLRTARSWTSHSCQHVRRLAIESLRPRLPWASRIKEFEVDPSPILDLCSRLIDDKSKYVLRSVANTVADVYKANPERAVAEVRSYLRRPSEHRRWVARHALRYPLRQGDTVVARLLEKL